jgi:hypothetical protein
VQAFERLIPYAAHAIGMSEGGMVRSFRPATHDDMPGILALRRAVTPDMWWDDEALVRWRYFGRFSEPSTPYWVFVKGGEVVGACGLEPVTLAVDGRDLEAVRTLDIMVHPNFDGRGLGLVMNTLLFRHFPILLVTGCNAASQNLITRMFQHTADLVFWKIVTGAHALVDLRRRPAHLSTILGGVDLLLGWGRWRRAVATPAGMHIRELTRFDERVTDLSRRCEQQGRVMVRRTEDYLNWRFMDNTRCRYRVLAAFTADRMDGYVVTRLNLARPNPRREAELVDWMAVGGARESGNPLPALFARAVATLVDDGACLVTCAAYGADIDHAMHTNHFHRREGQRIPFFVHASPPDVHERLASSGRWFLTQADLDVE